MRFSLVKGAEDNEIHKNMRYNVCAMRIWYKKTSNVDFRVLLETEGSDAVLEKINLASSISHGRVTKEVQMRHTLRVSYFKAHQKACKSCQQAKLCAYISCSLRLYLPCLPPYSAGKSPPASLATHFSF